MVNVLKFPTLFSFYSKIRAGIHNILGWNSQYTCQNTLNSEIYARALFREASHMQSFAKIKSLQNGGITLLFTDTEKINMSFNAIRENKILEKNSELTVVNKEV